MDRISALIKAKIKDAKAIANSEFGEEAALNPQLIVSIASMIVTRESAEIVGAELALTRGAKK